MPRTALTGNGRPLTGAPNWRYSAFHNSQSDEGRRSLLVFLKGQGEISDADLARDVGSTVARIRRLLPKESVQSAAALSDSADGETADIVISPVAEEPVVDIHATGCANGSDPELSPERKLFRDMLAEIAEEALAHNRPVAPLGAVLAATASADKGASAATEPVGPEASSGPTEEDKPDPPPARTKREEEEPDDEPRPPRPPIEHPHRDVTLVLYNRNSGRDVTVTFTAREHELWLGGTYMAHLERPKKRTRR